MATTSNFNDGPESWQPMLEAAMLVVSLMGERDARLKAHCERVANRAANFAEVFGLFSEDGLRFLYLAGLLHDIGYIAADEGLFSKPEPLSNEDQLSIKKHPVTGGVTVLSQYRGFEAVLPMVRHHHEAFDGSGWPDGKGLGLSIHRTRRDLRARGGEIEGSSREGVGSSLEPFWPRN